MNLAQTGHFLTQRRNALGLTQAQLAQRLDVTDKAVSKWERGKSLPDIALLNRLAAELRVSVVEILSGESLNVGRSSNLDEVLSQGEDLDQAGELTLPRTEAEDLLVSPYLFGCNLEHTRSCLAGGLSAQMLRNRKFAGKPTACEGCALEWFPIGERAIFSFDEPYTRHGEGYHMQRTIECNSLSVFAPYPEETAGVGQHGLSFAAGRAYLFAVVAKSAAGVTLSVSLTDRTGKIAYDCRTVAVKDADWTRYEVELCPTNADADGDLRITWEGGGSVCFGALSLLPKDNFRGMRKDVIEKLKELGIKVLRWPGGNFAGEFNWMDGLLPALRQAGVGRVGVVIECAGRTETMAQAVACAGNKATVMLFGLTKPSDQMPVYPFQLFKKELTLKTSYINPYTQKRALDLIGSGRIDVSSMVYQTAPLERLAAILSDPALRSKGKWIILPNG